MSWPLLNVACRIEPAVPALVWVRTKCQSTCPAERFAPSHSPASPWKFGSVDAIGGVWLRLVTLAVADTSVPPLAVASMPIASSDASATHMSPRRDRRVVGAALT
jgi:hypothetical protein